MFIRFVVGGEGEDHTQLTGVVTTAELLRRDGRLTPDEEWAFRDALEWFNENVPCPPFSTSGWSREAVCWFKDGAGEAIGRIRDLVRLLESAGVPVRMLRTRRPGKVLYEDAFQVVVYEWKQLAG